MSAFAQIKLSQCTSLVFAMRNATIEDLWTVRREYEAFDLNFDATLGFLCDIGMLATDSKSIQPSQSLKHILSINSEEVNLHSEIRREILRRLICSGGSSGGEARDYLSRFVQFEGRLRYVPPLSEKLATSDVRNFLIEMEVVEHVENLGEYTVIDQDVVAALFERTNVRCSPTDFLDLMVRRQAIGRSAELLILNYERRRLEHAPTLAAMIEHVGEIDVGAGYDIKSFEDITGEGHEPIPRLIEVKAVAKMDYRFHWSVNEVSVAKRYRDRYFLYLVPVESAGRVTVDGMKVIQDPASLFCSSEWSFGTESYYFEWRGSG